MFFFELIEKFVGLWLMIFVSLLLQKVIAEQLNLFRRNQKIHYTKFNHKTLMPTTNI